MCQSQRGGHGLSGDGSSSIGLSNFQEVRKFLRSVVTGLDIGPDKVRIGLAQYSDETYQEFLLKDHMDKTSLLEAVDTFKYRTGGTETGKAIDFLRTQYFTEEAGSRAGKRVPQIAVVIKDGDSTDDVIAPAQRLRQQGVIVFGIGVGAANLQELESIANWPPEHFLSSISNYAALQKLKDRLLKTVCISVEDQKQALAERFADIFFLVDSGVTAAEFQQIRSILTRLANQLNIGASAYRLGWAQYGREVTEEYLLNARQTRIETLNGLKRLRQRKLQPNEPRNLGKALMYASTNLFTSDAGSRAEQGYRQFLVVISGKDSDDPYFTEEAGSRAGKRVPQIAVVIKDGDSRTILIAPAQRLRQQGVIVFGIGVGAANLQELESIANWPPEHTSCPPSKLKDRLLKTVCISVEDQKQALAERFADIFFLVDSGVTAAEFQQIRSILTRLANQLNIGASAYRLGWAQYGQVKEEYLLNAHQTRIETLNGLKRLRQRKLQPNEPRNLGKR
ncbi:hypothetical protein F7725_017762 [Dissostichus mawsoni]|uniref:VWFA domain-containing protein n=1 Tax=Dissostichus mawsoni TaxID=36200 RepID=A0A7J5XPI9_DISMA|nr:hypothetical protein F7725_017762 [Dissostichus mawsoni]